MLNPAIKEMYSEDVVKILKEFAELLEQRGVVCEVHGVIKTVSEKNIPNTMAVKSSDCNDINLLQKCVREIRDLMTPEEADEAAAPYGATDWNIWEIHIKDGVQLWVK